MPRSRSRSPPSKRDRRRSRSRSRERRHRKKRSRSRSPRHRSPPRYRSRTPSPRRRSPSPRRRSRERSPSPRRRSREREKELGKADKKHHVRDRPEIDESKMEGLDEEQMDMMKLMGFANFDTTKGKKVDGNEAFAVNLQRKRRYRQYMNRRGGFNRPLDFVA